MTYAAYITYPNYEIIKTFLCEFLVDMQQHL